jgi:phosphotriesterase-related protein
MSVIRTVLGDIPPEDAGAVLMHEHMIAMWPGAEFDHRAVFDWDAVAEEVAAELRVGHERYGFQTVIDITPAELGRDPFFIAEVSRRSGVNLVAVTGFFCQSMGVPYHWRRQSIDELADFYVRDITQGMVFNNQVTPIRAGIIKIATGQDDLHPRPTPAGPHGRHIGEVEDTILRAAARAQVRTGAPLTTHTDPEDWAVTNIGAEHLDILEEEGVDPHRVITGHCFVNPRVDWLKEILDRGTSLQIDNIGTGWRDLDDEHISDAVAELVSAGYEDQLVISFDRFFYQRRGPLTENDPIVAEKMQIDYMHEIFFPLLRRKGVGGEAIDKMLVSNPGRHLAFDPPESPAAAGITDGSWAEEASAA